MRRIKEDRLNETFQRHLKLLHEKLKLDEVLEEGITDDWVKEGSFSTYKKPAVEKYEIATEDGILKTLEGEQEYKKGYYIL